MSVQMLQSMTGLHLNVPNVSEKIWVPDMCNIVKQSGTFVLWFPAMDSAKFGSIVLETKQGERRETIMRTQRGRKKENNTNCCTCIKHV